jgi:hypothetical protein
VPMPAPASRRRREKVVRLFGMASISPDFTIFHDRDVQLVCQ